VTEGLKARDMKGRHEIEQFVARFSEEELRSVWMCIENIMPALAAEGLFGCTYTPYDAQRLKDLLGVPPEFQVSAVVPFGFPETKPEARAPENLDGRLHVDAWGSAVH
jgi:nitroreductase